MREAESEECRIKLSSLRISIILGRKIYVENQPLLDLKSHSIYTNCVSLAI